MAKSSNTLLLLAAGGAALYFFTRKGSGAATDKKAALIGWSNSLTTDSDQAKAYFQAMLNQMTAQEINDTYDFIFNYIQKSISVPAGSALYNAINAISAKYNIFT